MLSPTAPVLSRHHVKAARLHPWTSGLAMTALVFVAGLLRFVGLGTYPRYIFDEYYYVPAALSLLGHPLARTANLAPPGYDPNLFSAPPFAKEIFALSISLFGNNPWAWRLPSALLGSLVPVLIYGLARDLFPQSRRIPWAAAWLAAFDGLFLSLSRIALLDSIALPFLIANGWGLWRVHQMLQGQRPWSTRFVILWGISLGLGFAAKWNGAQMILLSWIVLALSIRRGTTRPIRHHLFAWLASTFIALFAYIATYLYAWPQGFLQRSLPGGFLTGWAVLQWQIIQGMWHLQFVHPWSTTTLSMITFARPTAFIDQFGPHQTLVRLWAFSDPFLIWGGLLALGVQAIAGIRRFIQTHQWPPLSPWLFLGLWVLCTYATWFLTPRTKFDYYFAYTMPALIIALVATVGVGWRYWPMSWRGLAGLFVAIIIGTTLYLLPLWVAYPMPIGFYHHHWWQNAWNPRLAAVRSSTLHRSSP